MGYVMPASRIRKAKQFLIPKYALGRLFDNLVNVTASQIPRVSSISGPTSFVWLVSLTWTVILKRTSMYCKQCLIPLCLFMLSACQSTTGNMWLLQDDNDIQETPNSSASVTALYNSPNEDAKIAAAVKDFRILAFANKATTAPGVPIRYKLTHLEQRCGLRYLPGTGNVIDASFDAKQRQKMAEYAARYNEIILPACEKYFGKMPKSYKPVRHAQIPR